MLFLSKSRYCSAVQCPKMLWLRVKHPELFDDSVMNQAVLDMGNEVGDLAMGLFGPFREVPFGDLSGMIAETKTLLDQGTPVIAEASFSFRGAFCSVDILKVLGRNAVEIYEVKSSTEISDIYYHDAAYQYYVLTGLGYDVRGVYLVHIDRTYERHGTIELERLFKINDVTDRMKELYSDVAERIRFLDDYLSSEEEPVMDIGEHCFSPYECGFFRYCSRALLSPNVFDLSGMQTRTKIRYYRNGEAGFTDLLKDKKLNAGCRMQIEHELYDLPDHIEKDAVRSFLDSLRFPLYFLDFETFQTAVPPFDGTRPYEQIPFQYSLHILERPDGGLLHKEYLAYPGEDPRRKLAEQLCRDIPSGACTLAYNMSFEKSRIRELAERYPDLREHLLDISGHMQDLMTPFQKKQYYTRAMQGSYSIKYVLPALFPDDPSLDYHSLEGVHNGSEASAAFMKMGGMDPAELERYRTYLLEYCGLDTFAMVKIWEKLTESVS